VCRRKRGSTLTPTDGTEKEKEDVCVVRKLRNEKKGEKKRKETGKKHRAS
jgi:hypothetical protein